MRAMKGNRWWLRARHTCETDTIFVQVDRFIDGFVWCEGRAHAPFSTQVSNKTSPNTDFEQYQPPSKCIFFFCVCLEDNSAIACLLMLARVLDSSQRESNTCVVHYYEDNVIIYEINYIVINLHIRDTYKYRSYIVDI